jgi:hypothetical protein
MFEAYLDTIFAKCSSVPCEFDLILRVAADFRQDDLTNAYGHAAGRSSGRAVSLAVIALAG